MDSYNNNQEEQQLLVDETGEESKDQAEVQERIRQLMLLE